MFKSLGGVLAALMTGAGLGDPPRSCVRMLEQVHGLYNAGDYAGIYRLAGSELRGEMTAEQWLQQCRKLGSEAGRLVRVRSVGHMISPRSLTTVTVEFWVLSDFERGRKNERIAVTTGLFQGAELTGYEVRDSPRELQP